MLCGTLGQKIVAIRNHSQLKFKKGDKFVVRGVTDFKCNCSYNVLLDIGENTDLGKKSGCGKCMKSIEGNILWFNSTMFAPIVDLSDHTSESLIEELETELITT